jgi:putative membrane protein
MNDRIILRMVYAITAVVVVLVVALHYIPRPAVMPEFARHLPKLNAIINATCTILLGVSFLCIRRKKIAAHKKLNLAAFVLSTVFLLSYVAYHAVAPSTLFPKANPWRPVYLFILSSHILLAMIVLPLVLMSFYRGLQNQIELHRKIVRWSFPIWLYVTSTGVVVYLMISPFYPF